MLDQLPNEFNISNPLRHSRTHFSEPYTVLRVNVLEPHIFDTVIREYVLRELASYRRSDTVLVIQIRMDVPGIEQLFAVRLAPEALICSWIGLRDV